MDAARDKIVLKGSVQTDRRLKDTKRFLPPFFPTADSSLGQGLAGRIAAGVFTSYLARGQKLMHDGPCHDPAVFSSVSLLSLLPSCPVGVLVKQ